MAFTKYTKDTTIIGALGTNPAERALTTQEFKDKFDQFANEFVAWFNETHLPEVAEKAVLDEHKAETATQTELGHIKIGDGGSIDANGVYVPTGFKVGLFTRDISLASGDQSITGLGFKPRCIYVNYALQGTAFEGIGLYNKGALSWVLMNLNDQWEHAQAFIKYTDGSYKLHQAQVKSLDNDGFTITWTKGSGESIGTLSITYLALK